MSIKIVLAASNRKSSPQNGRKSMGIAPLPGSPAVRRDLLAGVSVLQTASCGLCPQAHGRMAGAVPGSPLGRQSQKMD